MAAPHLQLNPDDCSQIGLLILDYIKKHQLTFTEMAEQIGISRAALRIVCLKKGNPGKRTIPKLAEVLDKSEQELCRMVFENKLKLIYEENDDVINLTLNTLDSLVEILHKKLEKSPESKQLAQYDIYEYALKAVTSIPQQK
jgi:transcriptional regulator with XRE-family HTH domain